jgi:NADP-dependent 3-hydroxy acid dehydrogenase YdfG
MPTRSKIAITALRVAMSQPENVDINEILFRPTKQAL